MSEHSKRATESDGVVQEVAGAPVAWLRTSGTGSPVITEEFLRCFPMHRSEFECPLFTSEQVAALRASHAELLALLKESDRLYTNYGPCPKCCPFCGSFNVSEAEVMGASAAGLVAKDHFVQNACMGCGACGPEALIEFNEIGPSLAEKGTTAWNRRADGCGDSVRHQPSTGAAA